MTGGEVRGWEFEKHGHHVSVAVTGPLQLDHLGLVVEAAVRGLGVAYLPMSEAQPHLHCGKLVELLPDWPARISGLFLYHSARREPDSRLRAFMEVVKEVLP